MYPYIVFLAFLQAPQAGVPLVDDCSESARVIATVGSGDSVQVVSSRAGGAKTCYHVTAVIGGKSLDGYVLGSELKAIVDFEKEREKPLAPLPVPAPAATEKAAPTATPKPASAPVPEYDPSLPQFGNISGRNIRDKAVSLSAIQGKIILVCFWSPKNSRSVREAILVTRLVGQYHAQGVNGMTVSISSDRQLMDEAVEAINIPTVFGGAAIAASRGIAFDEIPRTYILNERRQILASGLTGKDLENRLKALTAGK